VSRNFSSLDTRVLRGGPALASVPYWTGYISMNTSSAKNLSFTGFYHLSINEDDLYNFQQLSVTVKWLPVNRVRTSGVISYSMNNLEQQYIMGKTIDRNKLYLFGSLDQNILEFTLRTAVFFTPELSLEYYGSQYLSVAIILTSRKLMKAGQGCIHNDIQKYDEGNLDIT
jgi:hypothetical protein